MEGEFNFLVFLPPGGARADARPLVSRRRDEVKAYVDGQQRASRPAKPALPIAPRDPQRELYGMLAARGSRRCSRPRYELSTVADAMRCVRDLAGARRGARREHGPGCPRSVVLRVDDPPRAPQWFSLLRNTAHSNVSHIFLEGSELLPAENTLTVAAGFIGAYPNAIYRVRRAELPALTAAIRGLASEDDYRKPRGPLRRATHQTRGSGPRATR